MGRAYSICGKQLHTKFLQKNIWTDRLEELDADEGRFWTGSNFAQNRD
jgi:hypothetical protein